MSIDSSTLSVIVPAHNEEFRIEGTLADLRLALPRAEIIVVVNDCTDRTLEIVRDAATLDSRLVLIEVPARVGKGGAVRIGLGLAHNEYVAFVDADGATSGSELGRLLDLFSNNDCIVASRWLPGSQIEVRQSAFRRFLGRGFNAAVRVLFGLRLWDTQCGAKLFRRAALVEVLDDVETADFAFDVDILYSLHRCGKRILEVPSVWRDRAGSTVNVGSAAPKMFLSLLRLRLRHSFMRIVLPIFDHSFRLAPIRSRRSLRYLVFAPSDGRSIYATPLERSVRDLLDQIASPSCEITWFAADPLRLVVPRWLHAMSAYFRLFRDKYDCVIEVLPDCDTFLTPAYSLKPKIVIQSQAKTLPPIYSSALIMSGESHTRRELEDALLLAVTRAGTHLYTDREGHLMLTQRLSNQTVRELLIGRARASV